MPSMLVLRSKQMFGHVRRALRLSNSVAGWPRRAFRLAQAELAGVRRRCGHDPVARLSAKDQRSRHTKSGWTANAVGWTVRLIQAVRQPRAWAVGMSYR